MGRKKPRKFRGFNLSVDYLDSSADASADASAEVSATEDSAVDEVVEVVEVVETVEVVEVAEEVLSEVSSTEPTIRRTRIRTTKRIAMTKESF